MGLETLNLYRDLTVSGSIKMVRVADLVSLDDLLAVINLQYWEVVQQ